MLPFAKRIKSKLLHTVWYAVYPSHTPLYLQLSLSPAALYFFVLFLDSKLLHLLPLAWNPALPLLPPLPSLTHQPACPVELIIEI